MTPKEKAHELVEKFKPFARGDDDSLAEKFNAKQCALIAVDEILDINSVDKDYDLSDYWQQVKTEIEKL